jgi:hypothetical protein
MAGAEGSWLPRGGPAPGSPWCRATQSPAVTSRQARSGAARHSAHDLLAAILRSKG